MSKTLFDWASENKKYEIYANEFTFDTMTVDGSDLKDLTYDPIKYTINTVQNIPVWKTQNQQTTIMPNSASSSGYSIDPNGFYSHLKLPSEHIRTKLKSVFGEKRPLVLSGARGSGKTHSLLELSCNYPYPVLLVHSSYLTSKIMTEKYTDINPDIQTYEVQRFLASKYVGNCNNLFIDNLELMDVDTILPDILSKAHSMRIIAVTMTD